MSAQAGADRGRRDLRLPLGIYRRGRLRDFASASSERNASPAFSSRQPDVAPIGLGARDSLRLEAGLCLYGHELDETVDPVEASLAWSIQKRRRVEGGFPGADAFGAALANGPARPRVGLRPDGRAPARDGTEILSADGGRIGVVTSGGFGPSVGTRRSRWAMSTRAHAQSARRSASSCAARRSSARVVALPFHPHAYYRG